MRLNNYMEQHDRIKEELNIIRKLVNYKDLENNAADIASHINKLAGKITIHLQLEDKHLYPQLMKDKNEKVVKMAEEYVNEMGNLFATFNEFKSKYNVKSKIIEGKSSFVNEINNIIKSIEARLSKEENNLYKLID